MASVTITIEDTKGGVMVTPSLTMNEITELVKDRKATRAHVLTLTGLIAIHEKAATQRKKTNNWWHKLWA